MQKLVCTISSTATGWLNPFAGKTVTVTGISFTCTHCGGWMTTCVMEDGMELNSMFSDDLVPVDTSLVPPTHNTSRLLKNIWIFGQARNDAWNRDQEPPKDLAAYREQYGTDWKDNRIFDVKQRKCW